MRKTLSGDNVYLRLLEGEDLLKRVQWINDPNIQASLHYNYPTSLARTQKWFDSIVMDKTRVDFSVFAQETKDLIGMCGFVDINMVVKKAEFYFAIGDQNYWGKDFGTEAGRLLLNYGFIELGLNRIYAYQNVDNRATTRVRERAGWKHEGTLRQDVYAHGKIYDRHVISIIREEWEVHPRYDL